MEPRSLGVVLPALNEQARLGPALDELRVLVVDDGSTDRTAQLGRLRRERAWYFP